MSALLRVDDLAVRLRPGGRGAAGTVLDGVSFTLAAGETLAVVGESGCGKSMLALALMGLLPPGATASGAVRLDGADLLTLPEPALCALRGRRLAMVFQEPMTALNPVRPIGWQIAEGMRLHLRLGRAEAAARTRRLLDRVGLPPARVSPDAYPHTLSGGQRQRVLIAMALACDPALLIADEFSTALDMTTQARILELLGELAAERRMALLLITHDLGLAAQAAARVLVLYAGRVVESGATRPVFQAAAHPYTRGLLAATLHGRAVPPGQPLPTIPGQVPGPFDRPPGCAFAPRCARAQADCRLTVPVSVPLGTPGAGAAEVACLHPLEAPATGGPS